MQLVRVQFGIRLANVRLEERVVFIALVILIELLLRVDRRRVTSIHRRSRTVRRRRLTGRLAAMMMSFYLPVEIHADAISRSVGVLVSKREHERVAGGLRTEARPPGQILYASLRLTEVDDVAGKFELLVVCDRISAQQLRRVHFAVATRLVVSDDNEIIEQTRTIMLSAECVAHNCVSLSISWHLTSRIGVRMHYSYLDCYERRNAGVVDEERTVPD